ncbi:hypothetical protein Ndes2526B_g05990 [Nannochloris sp. 'desiccata']
MSSLLSSTFILAILALQSTNAEPPKFYPRKEDVKFIKCDVCRYLAINAYEQGRELVLGKQASGEKVSEEDVIELMEKLTTAWRPEGEWITALHLTKSLTGSKLSVKNMERQGECGEACKTIERAAQEVMGEHDTDVAEAVYVQKHDSLKAFTTWLCEDLTKACSSTSQIPSLPSGHKAYPKFQVMAPDAQNIDRVMGQMADSGLKGQMYSREELMEKYMGEMGMDADDLGGMGGMGGLGKDEL